MTYTFEPDNEFTSTFNVLKAPVAGVASTDVPVRTMTPDYSGLRESFCLPPSKKLKSSIAFSEVSKFPSVYTFLLKYIKFDFITK